MDSSCSLPVSAASGQPEPTAEEIEYGIGGRSAGRRIGRERLLRYVHDVIRKQRKPLHEIVHDHVLPFLPAQSLLRLCAVSTSWNRHISSPFFAHTQSLSHRSPSGLLPTSQLYPPSHYLPFDPDSGAVPDPSFGFLPEHAVRVRASARGLVCCSSVGHAYRRTRYYVCNPATAQWTALPGSGVHEHRAVALLFRPSALNFFADFDLVGVVEVFNRKIRFEVFSSRTGSWRLSDEAVCGGELLCSELAVAAGGIAYWGTARATVLSYDPTADRCRVIGLPEDIAPQSSPWKLAEVDGRLCCCCVSGSSSSGQVAVGVYELEEGGTWTKVRMLEVVGGEVWPLISEGGDHEVLLSVDGRVVGFSLASGRGRLLRGPPAGVGTGECLPYVSSLVPVKRFRVEFDNH